MDNKGKILIPGINEAVAPVTDEELKLYEQIDFDLQEYARDVGAETLLHASKVGQGRCWGLPRCCRSPGSLTASCQVESGLARLGEFVPGAASSAGPAQVGRRPA